MSVLEAEQGKDGLMIFWIGLGLPHIVRQSQFIYFASQDDRAPQQLAPITVAPFSYPPNHTTQKKTDYNTENYVPYF